MKKLPIKIFVWMLEHTEKLFRVSSEQCAQQVKDIELEIVDIPSIIVGEINPEWIIQYEKMFHCKGAIETYDVCAYRINKLIAVIL